MRGYYSLIQYCPDTRRAEAANVGVLLLCPESHFLECRIASGNDRVRRFFGVHGEDRDRLHEIKQAFETRIQRDRDRIRQVEDLEHFIETRANKLLLTPPRNMRVTEPAQDLRRLFEELVGGRAHGEAVLKSGRGLSVKPRLRQLLSQPEVENKVKSNVQVKPLYGRTFTADYAFYNGKNSFVVPQTIHLDADQTLREAELLAIRGRQLAKHGIDQRKAELIIPLPDSNEEFSRTIRDVANLLRDNDVRTIFADDLEELVEEIREHADTLT